MKPISALNLSRTALNSPWWNSHPPSFSSFEILRCCKSTLVGSRSSRRYLHQSFKSRDQSRTWLELIPTIYLLQLGLYLHWWNSHPPSFSSFATLSCCKSTWVGSRSSGRYLHQSFKSRDQSRAWL